MWGRTEEGEDSEFVYDYYWMDPASASNFSPLSRIGRINLDVSELWDDDLLDCGGDAPPTPFPSSSPFPRLLVPSPPSLVLTS